MKSIVRTLHFRRVFQQRIQFNVELREMFYQQVELFLQGDTKKTRSHRLKGSMIGLRSFAVTADVRVIYKEEPDCYIFVDIGTHKQVYKR